MDDNRLLRKYSRANGFGWQTLVYNFLMADRYFRDLFNFGPYCGAITAITCFLVVFVLTYTVSSWAIFLMNTKKFKEICNTTEKKLPQKDSLLQVKPGYDCVNKHLQQVDVFLDKTKKVLRKEQLEVEIMNSRINSITELLNPQDQPQRSRSKTPRGYYRKNTPLKKLFT